MKLFEIANNEVGIQVEIITNQDVSFEDMDQMLLDRGWENTSNETTYGARRGWYEHSNPKDFAGFPSMRGAKLSTRKVWGNDNTRYGVIYNTFGDDGYVTVDVAIVQPTQKPTQKPTNDYGLSDEELQRRLKSADNWE